MKRWMLIVIALSTVATQVYALSFPRKALQNSRQLIVVTVSNKNDIHGLLQRYTRSSVKSKWKTVGFSIPVVVGGRGVVQGLVAKREGDMKTPTGAYPIKRLFGFGKKPTTFRLPYTQLTSNTICVDDPKSRYYNQIIDKSRVGKVDWRSAEAMAKHPVVYRWGAVVDYNTEKPTRGAGSCIFLHVRRELNKGTAGCIAMPAENILLVLGWLRAELHPMILIR